MTRPTRRKKKSVIKSPFFNDNQLLHDKFAKHLVNKYNIIKVDNVLHIYDDGCYITNELKLKQLMIQEIAELTRTHRSEIMDYLTLIAPNKKRDTDYISFENWLYNIKEHKLVEHDLNIITTNRIPLNIDLEAYSEIVDITLNKIACNDIEVRHLLEEMVGYIFLPDTRYQKAFILYNKGSNGKSTLIEMVQALLGEQNYSNLALQELDERFSRALLLNKMANIGDDIPKKFVNDSSTFKKIVTGNKIKAEEKGRTPFSFKPYSKLIFTCNEMVKFDDNSHGLYRRLVHIPFNAIFSKTDKDYDENIDDKLQTEESLQYLFVLAMEGLKRLEKNKGFTEPAIVKEAEYEFKKHNNPVLEFLEEHEIGGEEVGKAYGLYDFWCEENGYKKVSKKMFSQQVHKLTGATTYAKWKQGGVVRIYSK